MSAKGKYNKSGSKGSAKSRLQRDSGGHMNPGFLGREKVQTTQGRTGYEETKLGPGGKGRPIPLPSKD